jgi:serine/threonine protein phosphatase PrpC
MDVGSRSDTGHVRRRNEDALLVEPEIGVYAVADGMGGHAAGDVASAVAIERLRDALRQDREAEPAQRLVDALRAAHEAVASEAAATAGQEGMGTTAVVALLGKDTAWVGHVGDSRAYLLTGEELRPVTGDHGAGGYLTQALGLERGISPDVAEVPLHEGDRLLLCTDGLTNMVDDAGIERILREVEGAQAACDALARAALDAGGVDNVTTVVIDR